MSELVAAMQDWRGEALIPSQFIEQVKQLVREKAALEAKLEAMEKAISDDGRLKAAHFREWARQNDDRNGYRGSVLSELLLRLAAAQE